MAASMASIRTARVQILPQRRLAVARAEDDKKNLTFRPSKNALARSGRAVASTRTCSSRLPLVQLTCHPRPCRLRHLGSRRRGNLALGYTEDDSAGQSNIFAVEPKTYVAGSKADQTDGSSTLLIGAVAGVFALVLLVLGLNANTANVSPNKVQYEDAGKYQDLSTIARKFKSAA